REAPVGDPTGSPRGALRHVRLPGVHPLLGSDAHGDLDGEAQDGEVPLPSLVEGGSGVVPRAPPPAPSGAVGGPDGEVARALRVLRDHREFAVPRQLSTPRGACVAEVAQSPLGPRTHPVGAIWCVGAALPAAPGAAESRPSGHVAKSWPEEPDA